MEDDPPKRHKGNLWNVFQVAFVIAACLALACQAWAQLFSEKMTHNNQLGGLECGH